MKVFRAENNEVVRDGNRTNETVVDLSNLVEKLLKVKKPQRPKKSISSKEPSFLTSDIRLAFMKIGSRYITLQWKTIGY